MDQSKLKELQERLEILQLAADLNASRKAFRCVLTEVKDVFEAVVQDRKLITAIPVHTLLAKINRAFEIEKEKGKGSR